MSYGAIGGTGLSGPGYWRTNGDGSRVGYSVPGVDISRLNCLISWPMSRNPRKSVARKLLIDSHQNKIPHVEWGVLFW